jgi:predicted glycogen debranching enzyme
MEKNMKFIYGKHDWNTMARGQENCYLLSNGLGGFSSTTILGSVARNDHALFMACTTAPNHRYHMISRMEEKLQVAGKEVILSSQEFVNYTKNQEGYRYLQQFNFDLFPNWLIQYDGIEIKKTIVMRHEANTLAIRYTFDNRMDEAATFKIVPQLQFVAKGELLSEHQEFYVKDNCIQSNGLQLYFQTDAETRSYPTEFHKDLYHAYDARDGRDSIGRTAHNHELTIKLPANKNIICDLIYSMEPIKLSFNTIKEEETERITKIVNQAGISDEIGKQLVFSADQYIVQRESTGGKSIMAGYPFFADWGRDTMIAMVGCCISTRRFEDAKGIFRTFMKYCNKGLMPNMFPEGGNDPIYNTVDASLLFVAAVYEYYIESKDIEFIKEAYPVIKDILEWYKAGTDFHIKMDEDYLIQAGSGLEQVTWMDVRYEEILPTPRHGKPVEINAYWYNAIKIAAVFADIMGEERHGYEELAENVKQSFCKEFWNEAEGCLKDVVSGEEADLQIRCNQIWAVSVPFGMLDQEKELQVVNKVFEKLYTPYGLRTLNKEDDSFNPNYGGSLFKRDMAYHQGTVWPFPIGGYYLAYLKVHKESEEAICKVKEQLEVLMACMREGCVGQIAEIYDGETPTISQGCYAQAWSVSEILRVYAKLEKLD